MLVGLSVCTVSTRNRLRGWVSVLCTGVGLCTRRSERHVNGVCAHVRIVAGMCVWFAGVCALFGSRVRACVGCVWFLEVHACLVYENNELTKQEHVNHGRFMSSKRMG